MMRKAFNFNYVITVMVRGYNNALLCYGAMTPIPEIICRPTRHDTSARNIRDGKFRSCGVTVALPGHDTGVDPESETLDNSVTRLRRRSLCQTEYKAVFRRI